MCCIWVEGSAEEKVILKCFVDERFANTKNFADIFDRKAMLKMKNRYTSFEIMRYMIWRHVNSKSSKGYSTSYNQMILSQQLTLVCAWEHTIQSKYPLVM